MNNRNIYIPSAYNAVQKELNFLIATARGSVREALTEANVQLMKARQLWEQEGERINPERTRVAKKANRTKALFGSDAADRRTGEDESAG